MTLILMALGLILNQVHLVISRSQLTVSPVPSKSWLSRLGSIQMTFSASLGAFGAPLCGAARWGGCGGSPGSGMRNSVGAPPFPLSANPEALGLDLPEVGSRFGIRHASLEEVLELRSSQLRPGQPPDGTHPLEV